MPPEKHVFRAGDSAPGSLQQQGGKTVFRAGGTKPGRRSAHSEPATGQMPEPAQPSAQKAAPSAPKPGERSIRRPASHTGTAPETSVPAPKSSPARGPASEKDPFEARRARKKRPLALYVLAGLAAVLALSLAAWALDLPARLGAWSASDSGASQTVQAGQDWPAMVGDRLVGQAPAKVVSLSPMITEALLSLPGQQALCGITEYCDGRDSGLPTVGTPLLPRTEEIIALAPTYVLCQTPLTDSVQTELEQAGVEVIQMTAPTDFFTLREFYGQLGALLGGNETGRALGYGVVDRMTDTLARYSVALGNKATALLLPDLSGLAATADTVEWAVLGQVFRHPMMDAVDWMAGAECLNDDDADNDLDQIRAADPDVLLVADTVSPDELTAALGDLRAVQNGTVLYVDLRLLETLSPRLVFTAADAAALAYPDFANAG